MEKFVDYNVCNFNHKSMNEKIDSIIGLVNELSVKVAELPEKVLEKADARYASKTTERAVYGVIGALCLAVLAALYELVLKK